MENFREGVRLVLGDLNILTLMDWEQVESRVCGLKTVDVDRLKSITHY